ncbi:MAG: glycosyltransferase family 39 protein [Opitutaceae bacterium]
MATGLALLALGYAILLACHVGAYAGGSDSSGYLNHARALVSGRIQATPPALSHLAPADTTQYLYVPLGFRSGPNGRDIVPTYPVGLPLLLAGAATVFGWEFAPSIVFVVHGVLGLLLTFATARVFGLAARWAFVAALAVALSPLYLQMSLQTMSDVPALVWTTAAVVSAMLSRQRVRWAAIAGVAFALAVLIRPTNLLALAPIAIAFGFDWRRWLLFAASGAPGAVFLLLHNHAAYGKYLTTGYGDSAGLQLDYIPRTLAHYARWLPALFTPAILGVFALPWFKHHRSRPVAVLVAWLLVFTSFFATYYNTHETWWYLRFLLPAAPAFVVGGLLGFRSLLSPVLTPARALACLLGAFLATSANSVYWARRFYVLESGRGEQIYPLTARWVRDHLPADAVLAVMQHSGSLRYYSDFTLVRWDQFEPAQFPAIRDAVRAADRPLYAVLHPFEVEDGALSKRMPGAWTQIGTVRDVSIWKFDFIPRPPG